METRQNRPEIHYVDFGASKVYLRYDAETGTLYCRLSDRAFRVSRERLNEFMAFCRELGFRVGTV